MDSQFRYTDILVETFYSFETCHRGRIHVRPAPNQAFPQHLFVECSRKLTDNFPVGTVFRLRVCPKRKMDGRLHLYAHYQSCFDVVRLGVLKRDTNF